MTVDEALGVAVQHIRFGFARAWNIRLRPVQAGEPA